MQSLLPAPGTPVLVTGAGVSGLSAARVLGELGAVVTLCDGRPEALAAASGNPGVRAVLAADVDITEYELVVTSPGWRPDSPVLSAAAAAGIPVIGDVELAWRLDQSGRFGAPRTWLAITGTNGKTTTTTMVESILTAAGVSAAACGNIGLPITTVLAEPERVDYLAVELSSFQLYWAPSLCPAAGVVLNIAEDHLDWHGGMDGYVAAKAMILDGDIAVIGRDDPVASSLEGGSAATRVVGFTLGEPGPRDVGVVGGQLIDAAFGGGVVGQVAEIEPGGPSGILDALAAAALTRAVGIAPDAVARGLAAHQPGRHRSEVVAEVGGIRFIDDSKATNPHAARAALLAHESVVWVAGGQLKGASVDDLVRETAPRLVAAVLLGADRAEFARALARHAPNVPVVELPTSHDKDVAQVTNVDVSQADVIMADAVRRAREFASPGDVVLLAPAAASLDMFTSYAHRGEAFAQAVTGA